MGLGNLHGELRAQPNVMTFVDTWSCGSAKMGLGGGAEGKYAKSATEES